MTDFYSIYQRIQSAPKDHFPSPFTYSKLTIEILEQGVKYIQG